MAGYELWRVLLGGGLPGWRASLRPLLDPDRTQQIECPGCQKASRGKAGNRPLLFPRLRRRWPGRRCRQFSFHDLFGRNDRFGDSNGLVSLGESAKAVVLRATLDAHFQRRLMIVLGDD